MNATRVAQIQRELDALGDTHNWHSVAFGPIVMLILNEKHSMTLGNDARPACPTCHAIGGFIGDAPHAVRELLEDNRAAYDLLEAVLGDEPWLSEQVSPELVARWRALREGRPINGK